MVINRFCEVLYLSFERRPFALLIFFQYVCSDHVRCSCNTRPIYLVLCFGYYILVVYSKVHIFCYLLSFQLKNYYLSVLSTFSEILFARSHCTITFKSWFIYLFLCFRELLEVQNDS